MQNKYMTVGTNTPTVVEFTGFFFFFNNKNVREKISIPKCISMVFIALKDFQLYKLHT